MILDTEFNSAAQIPTDICLDAAAEAERRGFGGIWKGESNSRDPLVMLTAMAMRTEDVDLGTAIYHVYGRSPVTLAIQAATFNELSGGRLIVGLGVGNPIIAAWHGEEFSRPLARMREYVELLRLVYSGQKVPDYEGEFYASASGFKLAFAPPPEPLKVWVAGLGPQMVALAGRIADGLVINMAHGDMIKEVVEGFYESARKAGRDTSKLQVVSKIRVSLNEDPARARWALKKVLTFYSLQQGYSELLAKMGWGEIVDKIQATHKTEGFQAARKLIPDEMLEGVPMHAGSDLAGLEAKLALHAAAGVTRCVAAYVPTDDTRQWEEIQNYLNLAEPVVHKLAGVHKVAG